MPADRISPLMSAAVASPGLRAPGATSASRRFSPHARVALGPSLRASARAMDHRVLRLLRIRPSYAKELATVLRAPNTSVRRSLSRLAQVERSVAVQRRVLPIGSIDAGNRTKRVVD